MPDVKPGESRGDFVERCIPVVMGDGSAKDHDQAVAMCSQMFRDRAKSMVMKITKVQRLENGRTRWQARANTGEFDILQERFDQAFFDDVIKNFYRTQEAMSHGDPPPDGMTEPILDISHYSIYLPPEKRDLARAGWINKMWRDGRALFAQGFFDDTRLGQAAEKAAFDRRPEDRRVSIVVWPDYSRVEKEAGGRIIYRGGNGLAWMDSLAMTSSPADPGAVMEVTSKMDLKQDAEKVLGPDGKEIVAELENARTAKALPEGAIIKNDDETKTDGETPPADVSPEAQPVTMEDVQNWLGEQIPGLAEQVGQMIAPLSEQITALAGKTEAFEAQIRALGASQQEQVQKAIQNEGNIFARMWPDEKKLSVQGAGSTAKGEITVKKPTETKAEYAEGDVHAAIFGK